MRQRLVWTSVVFRVFGGREMHLMATDSGLCRITWPGEDYSALTVWRDKYMPGAELFKDTQALESSFRQVEEYLGGVRREFNIPLDLRGTPFQRSVWAALQHIPHGTTMSYGELVAAVGRPSAARAAGTANGCNPVPILVPCHRVIGKDGSLTGFRGGLSAKEELLRLEGAWR